MNLHKHQVYVLDQHSESFKSWSAIIRINTECKSLIMKLGRSTYLEIGYNTYKRIVQPVKWDNLALIPTFFRQLDKLSIHVFNLLINSTCQHVLHECFPIVFS